MLWAIERSQFSQESFEQRPDWVAENNSLLFFFFFFFSRNSKTGLDISLWKTLSHIGRSETGQEFTMHCLSHFLWTGAIYNFFHRFGNTMQWAKFSNINGNVFPTSAWKHLSNLINEILSWPWGFFYIKRPYYFHNISFNVIEYNLKK